MIPGVPFTDAALPPLHCHSNPLHVSAHWLPQQYPEHPLKCRYLVLQSCKYVHAMASCDMWCQFHLDYSRAYLQCCELCMLHLESHYIIHCISTHCVRVGHLCTGTLLLLKRFQIMWYFMVTTYNKIAWYAM